jgi:hypothetical protein
MKKTYQVGDTKTDKCRRCKKVSVGVIESTNPEIGAWIARFPFHSCDVN